MQVDLKAETYITLLEACTVALGNPAISERFKLEFELARQELEKALWPSKDEK